MVQRNAKCRQVYNGCARVSAAYHQRRLWSAPNLNIKMVVGHTCEAQAGKELIQKQLQTKSLTMTISDTFFYKELCVSLDQAQASEWLMKSKSRVSCSAAPKAWMQPMAFNPAWNQVQTHPEAFKTVQSRRNIEMQDNLGILELINKVGANNAGLLYTDAAHILLDSLADSPVHAQPPQRRRSGMRRCSHGELILPTRSG